VKRVLTITTDPVVRRDLDRTAGKLGLELTPLESFEDLDGVAGSPVAIVIDMGLQDALQAVAVCKERWSQALVAGFLATPDKELWTAAEQAGCDLVANRGALAASLLRRMQNWEGGRRMRLLSTQDIAGRIGVVQRLDDSSLGPLAVYHIGGQIFVAQDICPHAGARLSEGDLDLASAVITCPRHGSQFDLRTGDRLRGPSDELLGVHKVVVEGTEVYLQLD